VSHKKTYEYYRAAVIAIRPYTIGFMPADGYDLHDFKNWSPQKKAQVTKYVTEIRELTSRPNYLFRGRNKEHLKIAKEVAQHSPKTPKVKVAFIPYTPAKGDIKKKPDIIFKKGTVIVKTGARLRYSIPFDKKKLITDTDVEIARALSLAGKASMFTLQTGMFETPNPMSAGLVNREVKKLVAKYDGLQYIDGKKDPAHHHHSQWLNGIVAWEFKQGGHVKDLVNDIEKSKRELQQKNLNARRKRKRAEAKEVFEEKLEKAVIARLQKLGYKVK
jgi:hypothetical protein